jgi:hypothetical protein
MAIAEFAIDTKQAHLTAGYSVPRGTMVDTEEVEGERCRYRTCFDQQIWPLKVAAAILSGPPFQLPIMPPVGTVAVLAASAYLARRWVLAIQDRYASWVQAVPRLVWFGLILVFSLGQLALTGQFALALALTLAGFCLAMGLKQLRVPQQVSFGTLVLPLFVHHLGLVPTLNGWMF